MAKCDVCKKEMSSDHTFTCTERWFVKTEPATAEHPARSIVKRASIYLDDERRCHDCNISYGGFHHPGCDWERCPFCGCQLLTCDCEFVVMSREEMLTFVGTSEYGELDLEFADNAKGVVDAPTDPSVN